MKKHNLLLGIVYILAGMVLLLTAQLTETVLDSILVGLGAGAFCGGLMMTGKYFYWSRPENRERYQEKLSKEKIELHDEMKIILRDKSGRYTYILGIMVISISIMVFSVLGKLGMVYSRAIVIFLSVYLFFQLVAGVIIFRYLLKKYQ